MWGVRERQEGQEERSGVLTWVVVGVVLLDVQGKVQGASWVREPGSP